MTTLGAEHKSKGERGPVLCVCRRATLGWEKGECDYEKVTRGMAADKEGQLGWTYILAALESRKEKGGRGTKIGKRMKTGGERCHLEFCFKLQ